MGFMQPQITDKQEWWECDGLNGLEYFQADYFTNDQARENYSGPAKGLAITRKKAYGIRLSAPGYMDCTEWEIYTNKREAIKRYNELKREEDE